jgi:hypothetical protein
MIDMSAAGRSEHTVSGQPEQARDSSADIDQVERPGDAACWLRRVCPSCGTLAEVDPPFVCEQCKEQIPVQ